MSTIVHARDDDGTALTDAGADRVLRPAVPRRRRDDAQRARPAPCTRSPSTPASSTALRADPTLIATAVEEIVRWTTPSIYKRRTASRDVELAGVPIAAGDKVTFWEMSANRDERVVRRAVPLRRRPQPEPAPRLRVGCPLLPRREPGPPRDPGDARAAARARRARRAGRDDRVDAEQPAVRAEVACPCASSLPPDQEVPMTESDDRVAKGRELAARTARRRPARAARCRRR